MSSLPYKILGALTLLLIAYGSGYWMGRGNREIEIQEKIVETKGRETIVYKDRIVTVTKIIRPDGTVEEVTKTEEKEGGTTKESEEVAKSKERKEKSQVALYGIGLKYWGDMETALGTNPWPRVEITGEFRAGGPFWIQGGIRPLDHSAALGVSYQW